VLVASGANIAGFTVLVGELTALVGTFFWQRRDAGRTDAGSAASRR
jgi:hypothetical protein